MDIEGCYPYYNHEVLITTDTTEFKYYELDTNGALKVRKLYYVLQY